MATRKTKTKSEPKTEPKINRMRTTHIPLGSWIMFWALVLCTMALVVVNLGNAFAPPYPSNDEDMQTIAELQALRANLEKQVEDLQVQQMQGPDSNEPSHCDMSGEVAPIDSYVNYVDEETSVGMKIPFSTKWQNWKKGGCDFAPVYMHDGIAYFGPMTSNDRYEPRDARIAIGETTSTQVMDEWYKGLDAPGKQRRNINGLTVYSYAPSGFDGNIHYWRALGRSYTYFIQSAGWLTDAEAVKIIQSLKVVK